MRRIILACVLAALAVCGSAADTVLYYGPSGESLPPGKYTRAVIRWVNGKVVVVSQDVVLDVGGVPIPPPIPPPVPPPDTVTGQITAFIAAVTADPTKAETSKGIAECYRQVLALTKSVQGAEPKVLQALSRDDLMDAVIAGAVKDPALLRKAAEMVIDQLLSSPEVNKASAWKPFTDGMKTLTAPMDLAGVVNAYTVAMGLLGGGPVPPPVPPIPPDPTVPVKVSGLHVLIFHDPLTNGKLPQTQVDVFSAKSIRDWLTANCEKDKAGTPAFRNLKPGADLSKEVDAVWAQLDAAAGSGGADPYWILIDQAHWKVEPVPLTVEAALARLQQFKGGN